MATSLRVHGPGPGLPHRRLARHALDRNDAKDTRENRRDACLEIGEEWTAGKAIVDDMAGNPRYVPDENGTRAHCEAVYRFDLRRDEHRASFEPVFMDFAVAAPEQRVESVFPSDPRVRRIVGPSMRLRYARAGGRPARGSRGGSAGRAGRAGSAAAAGGMVDAAPAYGPGRRRG